MAVAEDTAPVFPACPTYGFQMTPRILVKRTEREGGYSRRDRKWSEALRMFNAVPLGNKVEADAYTIYNFFLAIGGQSTLFRFKDWIDFKSCDIEADYTALDQPFLLISGSPGGYQMLKAYTYGSFTEYRRITKPVGSTILVANQSGVVQATTAYTVEEATGLIVPNGSFSGTPGSWGGEFYVPCTFAEDLDIEIVNYRIQRLAAVLREERIEPLT